MRPIDLIFPLSMVFRQFGFLTLIMAQFFICQLPWSLELCWFNPIVDYLFIKVSQPLVAVLKEMDQYVGYFPQTRLIDANGFRKYVFLRHQKYLFKSWKYIFLKPDWLMKMASGNMYFLRYLIDIWFMISGLSLH